MDCLFCKIANHEINTTIRYEDEHFIAFDDINPKAPVHILIIPKKHISSINELKPPDAKLMGDLLLVAKKIAQDMGVGESGYRLVTNTGPDSGQIIFHLHFHLLGGTRLGDIA